MRRYTYMTTTELLPVDLYSAITDIRNWPQWDKDLEATSLEEAVRPGTRFSLKPKNGPKVQMRVELAAPPHRFTDVALLPLARMRTSHRFTAEGDQTRVETVIEIWGPLAFLWDKIIARKQALGAENQARSFLAYAKDRS